MTVHVYSVMLVSPVAAYTTARGVFASTTGEPSDASADWRELTDGTTDLNGDWVTTHRACITGARATVVAQLPLLAAAIPGATWHVLADGVGTPAEQAVKTRAAALLEDGLWLLEPEMGADASPTGRMLRVER